MRDIDVRQVLLKDIAGEHAKDCATRIVEELGLCRGAARVDIAVVNGSLHGYEIKSERDTLTRLPVQAEAYSQALDFVTVVAGSNHLDKVEAMVPAWWGLRQAQKSASEVSINLVRDGKRNPGVQPMAVAQLLWRAEALTVLEEYELARGYRTKTRAQICGRLVQDLSIHQLSNAVRTKLKARKDWRVHPR